MARAGWVVLGLGIAVAAGGALAFLASRAPELTPLPPAVVPGPPAPVLAAVSDPAPAAVSDPGPAAIPAGEGVLLGRLVRGGPPRPLAGSVEIVPPSGGPRRATAGDDGRFEVPGLPRGVPLRFEARSGDLPSARFADLRIPVAGALDLGDVALGPGAPVEVRVTDDRNAPIAGCVVTLHRTIEDRGVVPDAFGEGTRDITAPPPPAPEFRDSTSEAGAVRFPAVPPGTWLAVARSPGCVEGTADFILAEGYRWGPVRIRLGPAEILEGTVRSADGTPAPGLRIRGHWVTWPSGRPDRPNGRTETTTGQGGAFRLDGLSRGAIALWAEVSPAAWCCLASVKLPVTGPVDLRLPPSAALSGMVLDAGTGKPLPGAEVSASGQDSSWQVTEPAFRSVAVSDGSGAFRLAGLPQGGRFAVTVRVGGHVPLDDWVEIPRTGTAPDREFRLAAGAVVRGRVLGVDGTAVPNALVWARPVRPGPGTFRRDELGEETRRVRSGPDGAYRIVAVAPGTILLAATADGLLLPDLPLGLAWGYHPDALPESLKLEVAPGGEMVRDLAMVPGAVLEGVVVDETGKPAAGLAVRTGSWPRQDRHQNQSMVPDGEGVAGPTAADGSFRITGLMAGTRRFVHAAGPDFLEGWSRTFDLAEGEAIKDLRITVRRLAATVAGTVRWDDGTPAAGAQVGVSRWELRPDAAGMEGEAPFPVDAKGEFRAEGIRPGEYTVFAAAPGALGGVGPRLTLGSSEVREGIALVLARGGRIAGRVAGPDGRPVPGAVLLVEPAEEDQQEPPAEYAWMSSPGGNGPRVPVTRRSNVTADAEGRFRREGLAPRDVWVTAGAPGHLEAWVRTRPGEEAIAIRLERSLSITGRAVDAETGAPAAGVPVHVRAGEDVRIEREPEPEKTGDDGTFRIEGLGPGTYGVQFASHFNEPAQEFLEHTVGEVAAGTAGLEVRLRRGGVLAGKVVDQDGAPVGDVSLRLHEEEDGRMRFGFGVARLVTGVDGRFRFAGLGPGPFVVQVGGDDHFQATGGNRSVVATEVAGLLADGREVVLRVRRGLPIRGRILDPNGRPAHPDPHGGNGRVVFVPSGQELRGGRDETCFADGDTGAFETPPLPAGGTWDLHASGFAETEGAVVRGVAPGARVEIRLEAGLALSGRVVDEAGNPVPGGIRVELDPEGDGRRRFVDTRADGTFRAAGLVDGKYRIEAGGDGSDYLQGASKEAVPAGSTDVVIVTPKGASITGLVLDAKGKPVRFPQVRTKDGSGGSDSKEDGSFVVRGLKQGKARLVLRGPSRHGRDLDLGLFDAPSSGHVLTLTEDTPAAKPDEDDGEAGDGEDGANEEQGD